MATHVNYTAFNNTCCDGPLITNTIQTIHYYMQTKYKSSEICEIQYYTVI